MNRGVKIRLPYLTLLIAVALVADSTIADWLVEHWDVTLAGLILIIGATWVSTSTGVSTTGTMSVGGTATLVASDNLCAGMQFTGIGAAAAGKIGLNANQLALLGGSSGHGFFNSGGGPTTNVDAAGNWSMGGRINSATLQPGFLAVNNSDVPGVVSQNVPFPSEVYDDAGNFAANTFTATVPGRYSLSAGVSFTTDGTATVVITILTTNRNYPIGISNHVGVENGAHSGAPIADMDAGDTAQVRLASLVGTTTIKGAGTWFSGRLLA